MVHLLTITVHHLHKQQCGIRHMHAGTLSEGLCLYGLLILPACLPSSILLSQPHPVPWQQSLKHPFQKRMTGCIRQAQLQSFQLVTELKGITPSAASLRLATPSRAHLEVCDDHVGQTPAAQAAHVHFSQAALLQKALQQQRQWLHSRVDLLLQVHNQHRQ